MGLLDQTAMNSPEMGMAMGLLSAGGASRMPVSLGQGLAQGYQGYQQAAQAEQARQMQAMQIQQQKAQMDEMQRQKAALQQFRAQLPPPLQAQFDMDPKGFISAMRKQDEEYTLTPGAVRFRGKEKLAEAPMEVKPQTDLEKLMAARDRYPVGDPNRKLYDAAISKATTHAPNAAVNVFNNTKDDFKNERDLRNDFQGLPTTKAFREVQSAYDQIQTALKQVSPAGDLAAATKIMKILDPGSVVRESELGMAMAASGALDRISNYANMLTTGQKLTPAQRADFGNLAEKLYSVASDRYNQSVAEYQGTAKDYNLNPARVAKPAQKSTISPGGWSATLIPSGK